MAAASSAHAAKLVVHASPPRLSHFQRLLTEVTLRIDGERITGAGEPLRLLLEIVDEQGNTYRTNGELNPARIKLEKSAAVEYGWGVFLLPGTYHGRAGYHGEWKEFSVKAAPLRNDPLPELWRGLPAVEFIESTEPPEAWFLPEVKHLLELPHPRAPLEVVVNLSATESRVASHSWNGPTLGPLIRVLASIPGVQLTLIDVARQKVLARDADWASIRAAMQDTSGGAVHLKALEERKSSVRFAAGEIARHAKPGTLVFVSNAVDFDEVQQRAGRIEKVPGLRVFYLRVRPFPWPPEPVRPESPIARESGPDRLEPVLKPLSPKVVEAIDPQAVRKALAAILDETAAQSRAATGDSRII